MKTTKKARPGAGTSERACPGLAPRNNVYDYYTKFSAKCKPQSGQGRRFASVSWEFALTIIGPAWLVARFARLIDWMEMR